MQRQWFSVDDLTNYTINKQHIIKHLNKGAYQKSSELCLFSHVPKTAGTSLEQIVAKNFKVSETLHINAPDLNRLPAIIQAKKYLPKFICGHHPLHGLVYQLLSEQSLFHFTQLREPVDRVISYYNYVKGKTDHPMHQHTVKNNFIEFLNADPSPELSNGQCRRFSGYLHQGQASDSLLFQEALDTLTNCFSLVLTTCLFDEGLLLLKNRLKLKDIYYQKQNVSDKFLHKEELSDIELNFVSERNLADINLFNTIKNNCIELVSIEVPNQELHRFKTKNTTWQQQIN